MPRGFPPKPTVLQAREGNPGKRRLNRAELAEPVIRPKAPPHIRMNPRSRKVWKRLLDQVERLGIVREIDQVQLATLTEAVAIRELALEQLKALPEADQLMVKTPNGGQAQNPLLFVINRQAEIIHRIAIEFGMTAAARRRLQYDGSDPTGPVDALEALLGGEAGAKDDDDAVPVIH